MIALENSFLALKYDPPKQRGKISRDTSLYVPGLMRILHLPIAFCEFLCQPCSTLALSSLPHSYFEEAQSSAGEGACMWPAEKCTWIFSGNYAKRVGLADTCMQHLNNSKTIYWNKSWMGKHRYKKALICVYRFI